MFALKRIGRLGLIAAIATFAVAAVACGDDDDDGDSAATPAAASTPAGPASSPTAVTTDAATEPAGEATTVQVADAGELGTILTDEAGLTLYTFKNDVAGGGTSACGEGCVAAWPALTVVGEPTKPAEVPGELGTITRSDGATQVTYKGLPLHRFVNDAKPGDTMGQGVLDLWFVAQP